MSKLKGAKMEGSKVPAEQIKNPDLVAAIEKMQEDNTTENINKMIDEVMKAKFSSDFLKTATKKNFLAYSQIPMSFSSGRTPRSHRRLLLTLTV